MALNNSIAATKKTSNDKVVDFKCGEEVVRLSPNIIRKYLVNGNGAVTDQEIVMFLNLCRFQHLNPFLREAYLIKYGNNPATIVVGKDAITKRAMRNTAFCGQQAGVVVLNTETGVMENRLGAIVLKGEELVGGWAKVFVRGYQDPIEISVAFEEYVGLKKTGEVNEQWTKKPATMIRKVALVQALREAFPEDLEGMYDPTEMNIDVSDLASAPVDMDAPQQAIEPSAEDFASSAPEAPQPTEEPEGF